MEKRAIFLDRDGVINQLIEEKANLRSPRRMNEFRYESGVLEFIQDIKKLAFEVIVITNQPEVKRGLVTKKMVNDFHKKIHNDTGICNFFICWHDTDDNCGCRKPKPGLLLAASEKLNISLKDSYMIGDRDKDIIAAENVGCTGILYSQKLFATVLNRYIFASFPEIFSFIQSGNTLSRT